MWEMNLNKRSIINFGIQGGCATIMRDFEFRYRSLGYRIPMTQHDGFYSYIPVKYGTIDTKPIEDKIRCMRDAFIWGLDDLPGADLIEIDLNISGELDMIPGNVLIVDEKKYHLEYLGKRYVDKRAKKDLQYFSKYFMLNSSGDNVTNNDNQLNFYLGGKKCTRQILMGMGKEHQWSEPKIQVSRPRIHSNSNSTITGNRHNLSNLPAWKSSLVRRVGSKSPTVTPTLP